MSCYIVSKKDIDCLVYANLIVARFTQGLRCSAEDDNGLGAMLWAENVASVNARYAARHSVQSVDDYTAENVVDMGQRFPTGTPAAKTKTIMTMLKAISHYEYQSCEHDGWEGSKAQRYCAMIRLHLLQALPGYEEAPWGLE